MPKVSVIIPIYNVEKYIERCARSLFEQTLYDIEYIFIDDCTPDNSIDILKKVLEEYPSRIDNTIIAKMASNSGQAAVRSRGIQLATGDYIIHCDSDDWVDLDLYKRMYDDAIKFDADVVVSGIRDEYMGCGITRIKETFFRTGKEIVEHWFKLSVGMFCWNKLVKRAIYSSNNIKPFEGVNMWEDNGLMLRVFYYSNRVIQVDDVFYHYNHANQNSITSGYGRSAIDQMIKCANSLAEFFMDKPDWERYDKTVKTIKYMAKINLLTTHYAWLKEFYSLFPESNEATTWIDTYYFSRKGKIRYLFAKYHFAWLFVTMFKLYTFINSLVHITKCNQKK